MAKNIPAISRKVKRRLISEAGDKCANPGCPNLRTNIHHIKKWAVYESHDHRHMIAVCPSCHDAIHFGKLPISDEILYNWKRILREDSHVASQIYIEPGLETKVLLGTIAVTAPQEAVIFELSSNNKLQFRIIDGDILLLSLEVSTIFGEEVIRVRENHVRHKRKEHISYSQVPGHVRLSVPNSPDFVPPWIIEQMKLHEPDYGTADTITYVEIEVLKPGLVQVEGLWIEGDKAVVVTRKRLSFLTPDRILPIIGDGEQSVLKFMGPITSAMLGFKA